MKNVLLDAIPFQVDRPSLLNHLRIAEGSEDAASLERYVLEAERHARPKVLYREAYVQERGADFILVDGVKLTSRILRVNLDQVYRVFPYVATCGAELEEWSHSIQDLLESFWAGAIKEQALRAATRTLLADLEARFSPGKTAQMNPGSLEDWPMSEQRPFFTLLGDPTAAIGVQLSDSFLMSPIKSVSGLRFPTETAYENCQLCPREGCPGRRAPYDSELYDRRYRS